MTTDITELAQSHELRNKVNHRLYGALEFQGTSGEHATVTLSIDECKSIIAAMDERLALVESLEKVQQYAKERDAENQDLMLTVGRLRVEREELESRTVKLPERYAWQLGYIVPDPNGDLLDLDDVIAALAAAGIKVEAE